MPSLSLSDERSAFRRSTETSWLTPCSAIVTPKSRSIRAIVTAWCVMMRKRVSVRRVISSSRSQKRVTFASSSGASTSSSTQIGAGLARKTAKIRASAVSVCSPPERSERVDELLARRLAHDLEPRFQRVVAFDQDELRLAPAEEVGEEQREVGVHLLERGQQPLAPLAVEARDAGAERRDRVLEVGRFGDQRVVFGLDLAGVLLGAEVHRAQGVALAAEALDVGLDGVGGGTAEGRARARARRAPRGRLEALPRCGRRRGDGLARRPRPRFGAGAAFARVGGGGARRRVRRRRPRAVPSRPRRARRRRRRSVSASALAAIELRALCRDRSGRRPALGEVAVRRPCRSSISAMRSPAVSSRLRQSPVRGRCP